ncbi:MAG: GAF domain-containing protein [Desulfovibrio sp.]|nr:GAF domain-containing protein [Desulfovibrio sp.]
MPAEGQEQDLAAAGPEELRAQVARLTEHLSHLTDIGLALSGEQNRDRLLEMIVSLARSITGADAGTLYIVDDTGRKLEFVVLQNDTMNVRLGGTSGNPVTLPPVNLYNDAGEENHANVSSHVALTREVVNIEDVYCAEGFDFTGTRRYDAGTGYRSRSMLVIPMENHEHEVIGVLQLLNAKDKKSGEVAAFSSVGLAAVQSLATQAAVALTNTQLIQGLKALLYSFMQSIAAAIDAKSPYTRGHIDRVVDLTMRIAEAVNAQEDGPFKDVRFNENELEELKLAAWMHDVGKITTPVHVVDKATKLEAIVDRIDMVATRFKLIGKALQAELLEKLLELASAGATRERMFAVTEEMERRRQELEDDLAFVVSCNKPGEFMSDERIERVRTIAARTYRDGEEEKPWLTEDEVRNLCIRKGTLTDAERKIIEDHTVVTLDMLSRLPFPKRLARVPEFAGAHHEKLDGTGYPNRIGGDQLSLQARILAVADVFEALTAKDRPYKEPMKLSQAMKIMGFMVKDKHMDPQVFDLFFASGVYKDYAQAHMSEAQLDEVPPPAPPAAPPR